VFTLTSLTVANTHIAITLLTCRIQQLNGQK